MKNICLNWSISILSGLFLLFMLTILGFIFKVPIIGIYLPLACLATIFLIIYFTIKDNVKNLTRSLLAQFLILGDFFLIVGVLCYFIPDISFDGTTYHQAMMILMKWGLNPFYDRVHDFAMNQKYVFTTSIPYIQHFLKFFEIIGTNIYVLFGKIELTKITNYIFLLIAFCYSFYTFKNLNLSNLKSTFFAILFVYNPVCVCQMLSNYVDGVFYYAFLILIFSLINYVKGFDKNKSLAVILMSAVIFANIKLTGMFTVVIILTAFLLAFKSKELLKVSIVALVLILVTGINPYFTNLADGKNPFYPIIKDSITDANKEYMGSSYPPGFEKMNRVQKFLFSTFAVSDNISPLIPSGKVPRLKIPFTISGDYSFYSEATRLAGFGYFFSGILVSALILCIFLRFEDKEDKKLFFVIMSILAISILGNHEAWWARFVPQFWALPFFIFLFLFKNTQTNIKIIIVTSLLMVIGFVNSFIINCQYFKFVTGMANTFWNFFKNSEKVLYFPADYPIKTKKFETMPVKLQEHGIEVIYIQQ